MKGWLPGPLGMFCGSEQRCHSNTTGAHALTPLQARGLKQLSLAGFFFITFDIYVSCFKSQNVLHIGILLELHSGLVRSLFY